MKKTIAIALMAIATSLFGNQQTQAVEAIAQHIREVQRARAERIRRLGERADRIAISQANEGNRKMFEQMRNLDENKEANKRLMEIIFDGNTSWGRRNREMMRNCKQTMKRSNKRTSFSNKKNTLKSNDTRLDNQKFSGSGPARRRK